MQLMNIAKQSLDFIPANECPTFTHEIFNLLKTIERQQSEELKVIE
jgi:hypothetical protein